MSWFKDVKELAKEFGATVSRANSGHLLVRGEGWSLTVPGTPSDRRALKNARARCRAKQRATLKD